MSFSIHFHSMLSLLYSLPSIHWPTSGMTALISSHQWPIIFWRQMGPPFCVSQIVTNLCQSSSNFNSLLMRSKIKRKVHKDSHITNLSMTKLRDWILFIIDVCRSCGMDGGMWAGHVVVMGGGMFACHMVSTWYGWMLLACKVTWYQWVPVYFQVTCYRWASLFAGIWYGWMWPFCRLHVWDG